MEEQKNWAKFLSEIERSVSIPDSIEDCKNLLDRFNSIDEDYRDNAAPRIYQWMWKVALRSGKLSLANSYAKKFLQYLVDYKRIPQLKIFIDTIHEAGLLKKTSAEYNLIEELLLGKRKKITASDLRHLDFLVEHPEHWKQFPDFLKQYLLFDDDWSLDKWKLCYEYVLKQHFDKEIFIVLLGKAGELEKRQAEQKFIELLQVKKIKIPSKKTSEVKSYASTPENLNLDYDQIAMDLLSGQKEPNDEEQRRVLNSLKYISEPDLMAKGQEMIVAFELLGMEQVVRTLCGKLVKILSTVKEKAGVYYVWAHSLCNSGEFYQAIDLIDEVLQREPLIKEEQLAFKYLKAEACLKLKKIKMAKELFLEIKKENPHYRLVGERLKTIEAS